MFLVHSFSKTKKLAVSTLNRLRPFPKQLGSFTKHGFSPGLIEDSKVGRIECQHIKSLHHMQYWVQAHRPTLKCSPLMRLIHWGNTTGVFCGQCILFFWLFNESGALKKSQAHVFFSQATFTLSMSGNRSVASRFPRVLCFFLGCQVYWYTTFQTMPRWLTMFSSSWSAWLFLCCSALIEPLCSEATQLSTSTSPCSKD